MEPFLGQICTFGFNFAPRGWAQCNGQLLPISQNTALFSLLGTTYGGDGRTTFALPDLRSRVAVSQGTGPGEPTIKIGQRGGNAYTTLLPQNLPAHSHGLTNMGIPYNEEGPANGGATLTSVNVNNEDAEEVLSVNKTSTDNTGSNTQFSNMQPFLGVNVCIALVGLFPSRS